jgi:hypothetical protein
MKTYGGVFYSALTLPLYKDPIEIIEDLEKVALNREYHIVTYLKSCYYQFFVNAECCDAFYAIGQAMKNSLIEMPTERESAINLVENSRFMDKNVILIDTFDPLSFALRSFASIQMHISSEVLMIDQLAMALQKGSLLLEPMDIV